MMFWKKYNKVLLIVLFVIWGCLVFGTGFALAQQDESSNAIDLGVTYGEQTGLGGDDIRLIIARVIRAALGLLGIIVLAIMLYGGFVYMTAAGNEEKVSQAKKILINGTIGLLIILASLAIVQFIFSKLQEATLGGVSENCQTEEYAQTHLQECFPGPMDDFCKKDPLLCCEVKLNEEGVFFAKSITPVSEDTRMNNVAGRSILSMPINTKFTADKILVVKQGDKDITNKFDFSFISNAKGEHIGVEAAYKTGQGLCADGKTPCLDNGKYSLEVNKDLTSQTGKKIMEVTDKQCPFPLSADFAIANKDKLALNFDGASNYVDLGSNPLKDGSMTIETWIYPTDESSEIKPIVAVNSEQFSLYQQNKNLKFRLAGIHPPGGEGYCDVVTVGVLEMNKWQHVVATYDEFTMKQRIYINGKFLGQADMAKQQNACKTISGGTYKLKIGMQEVNFAQIVNKFFPGKISDVCLYNAYLDPSQIQLSYENGRGHCGEAAQDGLKGVWHLDAGYGDKVINLVNPGQNDGKIIGPSTWSLDPYVAVNPDAYFSFGGTDANIELDNNSTADFKDKFSMSLWLRVDGENADGLGDHIIDKHQGGAPGTGYLLYYSPGIKSLAFDLRRADGALGIYESIVIGKWYQVIWTYDGKESKVYLNGELKQTKIASSKNDINPYNGKLYIGGDQSGDEKYRFKGSIDEIHLYDRVLDNAEIRVLSGQRSGPYVNMNEKSGLVAGYRFDEGSGTTVGDFSNNKHTAKVAGSGYSWVKNISKGWTIDKVLPFLANITLDGKTDVEKVYAGKLYSVASQVIDNSGAGYGSVKIERETKSKGKESVTDYFTGPAVKRPGGSDTWPDNPYNLNYLLAIGQDLKELAKYTVSVKAYDIDQNFSTTEASFVVEPGVCENDPMAEGCGGLPGDDCTADWQCDSGKCVEGKCIAQPKILDVYQLNGAAGNYVTIVGKYFGAEKGTVQFGYDDKWVDAKIVDCQKKISWYNTWIIVEVPADVDLPLGSKSAIKVERADSTKDNPLLDYSNDDFGPKLDLFEKNIIKRPGLCAVSVAENQSVPAGAVAAPPKTAVVAVGSGLGNGAKSKIRFGDIQAPYTSWTDTLINSKVPENMKAGVSVVYVDVDNITSNGVPFTVLASGDVAKDMPVIDAIDPSITTPGSFVTIYGHGFGNTKGTIYLASSAEAAIECAKKDGVGACDALNLVLPDSCGWTWTDMQIVAQVSDSSPANKYFLILKNALGFYSSGEDPFEIKAGDPNPGLCKLEPNSGSAPLPDGEFLELRGANFSESAGEDAVYFWQNKASVDKMETWLKTSNNEIKDADGGFIRAVMPMSDGLSMQTGPIKVGVTKNNQTLFSNSLKYTVSDCRQADDKLKYAMEDMGLQCCSAGGSEVGQWKSGAFACAGEPRLAGYVWRFTTGKIHQLPKVVEECNEVDWNSQDKIISYPSPVPSVLWTKGKETCRNATIAVRFTVPMDESGLKEQDKDGKFVNVKVFECSKGDNPDCDKGKLEVPAGELYMEMVGPSILEIRKVPPQSELKSDQWYHVELSDKIISKDCGEIGLAKCYQDNLQKTKPCGAGTAYCFDFKTGGAENLCYIKNASIAPPSYTVHLLGLVLNPAHPFDSQPPHPYFYFVWGRGDQECVVLNVDGMGWKWGPGVADEKEAFAVVSPTKAGEKPAYIDSRAEATALQNAPKGVELNASLDKVIGKETINILEKLTGSAKPAEISSSTGDIFTIASFAGEKWELDEYYTVKVSYELDEIVSTSTMAKKPYLTEDKKIGYFWELPRYVYSKAPANKIYVIDKIYDNGKKERSFVYGGAVKLEHKQVFDKNNIAGWSKGVYTIKKGVKETVLYIGGEDGTVADFKTNKAMPDTDLVWKGSVYLGGQSKNAAGSYPLIGKINYLTVDKTSYLNQSIEAKSILFIDLYDPQVVKWWPNCLEACVNTGIGVKFNMPMFQSDYVGAIKIEKCLDGENCANKEQIAWDYNAGASDGNILRALPIDGTALLASSTWYMVTISKEVHALYTFDPEDSTDKDMAESMKEDFVWKFRTKDDNTPCVVSTVSVLPNPFMATIVGQKTKYTASPISSPDACSPDGQELNPWLYGWQWASSHQEQEVATTTNFSAITKGSTFCGLDCKKLGSNVSSKDIAPFLCGNGKLEPGEDCELDGWFVYYDANNPNGIQKSEEPGKSCTLSCLRPGNQKFSTSTTELGYCGNGTVEPNFGEECDVSDKENGIYCDKNCTWAGSSTIKGSGEHDTLCGSGEKTMGEDCDTAIISTSTPYSQVGCSNKCLHLGTQLARSWCDDNEKSENFPAEFKKTISLSCQKAISVCGNGKLESGEECDLKSKTDITCSNKCLLQNICKTTDVPAGLKCDPKLEGCKSDCTLAGSSVFYKSPSLCGDGVVGTGEYVECEKGASKNILGANPFQFVTAIGEGVVNDKTKTQQTDISAKTVAYLKAGNNVVTLPPDQQKTGIGKYELKCGNTENKAPQSIGPVADNKYQYNDCPLGPNKNLTEKGVATNSCCYDRAYRTAEYPVHGSVDVCRNAFISVDFTDHFIDEKSLIGNLRIAIGHEKTNDFKCNQIVQEDVSQDIYKLVFNDAGNVKKEGGFWHGLWSKIKGMFVRLFVGEVLADNDANLKNKVWCVGEVKAVPELHYEWSKNLSTVTTTVALYIDNLLPKNSTVAIFLHGGIDGIKDGQGIGIRNPELAKPILDDVWFFDTSEEICKLESITVNPDSQLFNQPSVSHPFSAITESTNGQKIQSIPNQYSWTWDWQPQNNAIFDIPSPKGSDSAKDNINIAARNVEGVLMAVANAKVTKDVTGGSTGQVFTGITNLEAMFCENPWPPIEYFPFEEGMGFGKTKNISGFKPGGPFNGSILPSINNNQYLNFKMSYCADSGKSGVSADDLPYLKPFLFLKEGTDVNISKQCNVSEKLCPLGTECDSTLYNIPAVGNINVPVGKGVCWNGDGDINLVNNKQVNCGALQDCLGQDAWKPLVTILPEATKYNSVLWASVDDSFTYAIVNSLDGVSTHALAILDASNNEGIGWLPMDGFQDAFLLDKHVFVTTDASRKYLLVLNVSNPSSPVIEGKYQFSNVAPRQVVVVGTKAYVTALSSQTPGQYGLYELDVSNAAAPKVLVGSTITGNPVDLRVLGNYAYVLDSANAKVDVFDVSNPGSLPIPKALTMKPADFNVLTQQVTGLDVNNDSIFIATKFNTFGGRIYKFKKPALDKDGVIELVKKVDVLGDVDDINTAAPKGITVVGDVAYVTFGTAGLRGVNMSNVGLPGIGSFDPDPPAIISHVEILGPAAILADSASGVITVLNISATTKDVFCNTNLTQYQDTCKMPMMAESIFTKTMTDETLKRFMFMSDRNDDIIGVQIFKNDRWFKASEWLNKQPSDIGKISGMKSAMVGGYEAVTDGNNYYINALNEASDRKIYSNIYQFSINKDAQQSTRQVFDQLLKSLKFNINISDFGYCLDSFVIMTPSIFYSDAQKTITSSTCVTDFDCRDLSGDAKENTNGYCSNAKTKLFRDWARLPTYKSMQWNFEKYYNDNGKYPELKSGTYIPGYTVSMWSSWNTLGSIVNGLPTDKINKWVGCPDAKADPQTCWNAASSTFSCPRFASVYEYEFVSSTKSGTASYMFHGPLEYFALGSDVAKAFINTDYFTTERGCTPLAVYSPFGAKCGDGLVNTNEECDPPGKTVKSGWGVLDGKKGKCMFGYQTVDWDNSCYGNAECGFTFVVDAGWSSATYSDKAKFCTYEGKELTDLSAPQMGVVKKWDFGCETVDECKKAETYQKRIYDKNNGNINASGIMVNVSGIADWLKGAQNKIGCKSISELTTNPYFSSVPVTCKDGVASSSGDCPDNYQASKKCSVNCKWEYSSCKSTVVCGNGKIEAGEECDDGTLNGTYGHCASDKSYLGFPGYACKKQHPQSCGNGEIDYNKKTGKPLEVCDKADPNLQKGYCKNLVPAFFVSDALSLTHQACDGVSQLDCIYKPKGLYVGPCLSVDEPIYDFKKENSCSWDCQNYGEYCGDGKVKQGLEECDDGNTKEQDGCNNACLAENLACKNYPALFSISTYPSNTVVSVTKGGNSKEIVIEECKSTGAQICRAYGLSCNRVEKLILSPTVTNPLNTKWTVVSNDNIDSCDFDIYSYTPSDYMTTAKIGKLQVVCTGIYSGPVVDSTPAATLVEVCGNGKKETYKDDAGKETVEACDLGAQNGVKCTPSYGKSCTYCSAKCDEVLTVDPIEYCGNGKIEAIKYDFFTKWPIEWEKCEKVGDDIWRFDSYNQLFSKLTTSTAKCGDKGSFKCDNCILEDQCVDCGKLSKIDGGVVPKVSLLYPANGGAKDDLVLSSVPDVYQNYPALFRSPLNPNKALTKMPFLGSTDSVGIESHPFCSNEYGLFFNYVEIWNRKYGEAGISAAPFSWQNFDDDWPVINKYGSLFDYPVAGESKEVKNDVVISQAVPPGVFRVVVRWVNEGNDGTFLGVLYNKGFSTTDKFWSLTEAGGPSATCYKMSQVDIVKDNISGKYWWPVSGGGCEYFDQTAYVHPVLQTTRISTQAMTIDTNKLADGNMHAPFAFFVDALDEPIYNYKDKDLQVEVYEYHDGQIAEFSIYKPEPVFEIKDSADTSTNVSAEYWHVFNLVYNEVKQKYEVKPVKKIVTGFCEMQQYIPGEVCNKTQ